MRSILTLLAIFVLFASCEDNKQPSDLPQTLEVSLLETKTLEIGGEIWTVTYKEIVENSLCPPDAVCVWLGRLVATVEINRVEHILAIGDLESGVESGSLSQSVEIRGIEVFLAKAVVPQDTIVSKITLTFSNSD